MRGRGVESVFTHYFYVVILELSELSERCFLNDSSRRWWLLEFTLSVLEFASWSCILYLIEYKFIQVMKQKIHRRVFSYIKYICCIDGISL